MSSTTQQQAPPIPIAEKLRDVQSLRPFPTAAIRLIEACRDPKCTAREVADIIQRDPGLAAKLMRMSNSSMFGCSGKIHTVDHAVVLLGMRCVRDLALAMAAAKMFSQGDTAAKERQDLWNHSLGCACVARQIAEVVPGIVPNEAFLAGLFHDVGKLVMYDLVPNHYIQLGELAKSQNKNHHKIEQQLFGMTHTELGGTFGRQCALPSEVICCIESHHDAEIVNQHAELVRVIELANACTKAWQIGSDAEACERTLATIENHTLPITAESLEAIREASLADFNESQQICNE